MLIERLRMSARSHPLAQFTHLVRAAMGSPSDGIVNQTRLVAPEADR